MGIDNFVFINGGFFEMGSPKSERGHIVYETQHEVFLNNFYLSKFPVKVGEFKEFVQSSGYQISEGADIISNDYRKWEKQNNGGWQNPYFYQNESHPVVCIAWHDAIMYCNWKSQIEGLDTVYTFDEKIKIWVYPNWNANGYRLPTEAEWEYSCRAGTTTPFNTGYDITTDQANYNGNYPYKKSKPKGVFRKGTTEAGIFLPNNWGLYDMHGNVNEWCWDLYNDNFHSGELEINPTGPSIGQWRTHRGGSWSVGAQYLRSAERSCAGIFLRINNIGFRIAKNAEK